MDLRQTHMEDMFGPSLGQVLMSMSKVKVATWDKETFFGHFRSQRTAKHLQHLVVG